MKSYYKLFLVFLFWNVCSFAQVVPKIKWQKTIGGNALDVLTEIEKTSDGGFILGGYSASDSGLDKTENIIGGMWAADYWVLKIDSLGNILWQNTVGGEGDDILHSIKQTFDGGYIIGGSSRSDSSGDKTENLLGYWLVKLYSNGNVEWENTICGNNGTGIESISSVEQTTDGGYILGGTSDTHIGYDKTENSNGYNDYWIVKVNLGGFVQWQNNIGGGHQDTLTVIHQTPDGGYIVGGFSYSEISGDKSEASKGDCDYWIIKLNQIGIIQWQKTIGGGHSDKLNDILLTPDGGFILAGHSSSNSGFGDKTQDCKGASDYWIVKTDSLGNILWDKTIGGNKNDELYSIKQTADGGYILGGQSSSGVSGDKTEINHNPSMWSYDYWIVKTDALGNIQWQNTIGGSYDDRLNSLEYLNSGDYLLAGFSDSQISGDKTYSSNGYYDYWIMILDENFSTITGKLFVDANTNNVQDSGEASLINKKVTESNGQIAFSDNNGRYTLSVFDTGTYVITSPPINFLVSIPPAHVVSIPSINITDSLNDFAFVPGVFNDLCVTITPTSAFRPGFDAGYIINYENAGNTILNPTIILFLDTMMSYLFSYPSANNVSADSIIWNLPPLGPFQSGSISVSVNLLTNTGIGTNIHASVRIEPLAGDANIDCNFSTTVIETTGSFDPNDILVNEDTLLTIQLVNPPFLEYIIRFQNTGTDTAFTVKILNPIDTTRLDLNTIEFVASSHSVNLQWNDWEQNMQFKFENILLPDSNIDEPASHGFVRYRLKPKSNLVSGDSIVNYAGIYFDFNDAVLTNYAVTKIVLPTSVSNFNKLNLDFNLYPNPAGNKITIEGWVFTNKTLIRVYDLLGQTALVKLVQDTNEKSVELSIDNLKPGVYFIEITTGNSIGRKKFVKH